MRHTARDSDRCTHTNRSVNHTELETESIAPDITGVYSIFKNFFYRIKSTAVQTTCTKDRWPWWKVLDRIIQRVWTVSYTHLRAHETGRKLVCRLLLEKKTT